MATLYVTEPGARVEKEHGRLLVTKEDEVIAAAPLAHVSEVVLVGGVGVTTPAMLTLLDNGAGLTLISPTGQLRGRLRPAEALNVLLRRAQYQRAGEARFALEISRAIVAGKLRNCRTLARRMARGKEEMENPKAQAPNPKGERESELAEGENPKPVVSDAYAEPSQVPSSKSQVLADRRSEAREASPEGARMEEQESESAWAEAQEAFGRLNQALANVPLARDVAELRGLEGQGSKAYFRVLRAALRAELTFEKRTRRPPKDPANALLSLAYSLLTNALFTAAEVAGLDAYAGFFHADKYGRPALALDLVEEFRPIVADSVVLSVVNRRMLEPDDFETLTPGPVSDRPSGRGAGGEGVRLSRRGLRVFLMQFTRRLQTEVYHPTAGRALSYQKIFEVQARALRQCIERGEPDYQPFLAR